MTVSEPTPPDMTLRAVEFRGTVSKVYHKVDKSFSLSIASDLEFTLDELWPLMVIKDAAVSCAVFVDPDGIGTEGIKKVDGTKKGDRWGTMGQQCRFRIEELGRREGIADGPELEAFYVDYMETRIIPYLDKQLAPRRNPDLPL